MASEPPHGPSSQSAYPSSPYEEPYSPHQFTQPSYFSHIQTSNEAPAVSYNEAPSQPRVYPTPQATRANSDRNPPGSAAQARPAINTPSTFSPLPTYGTNSHPSPSPTQRSPTSHSYPPPTGMNPPTLLMSHSIRKELLIIHHPVDLVGIWVWLHISSFPHPNSLSRQLVRVPSCHWMSSHLATIRAEGGTQDDLQNIIRHHRPHIQLSPSPEVLIMRVFSMIPRRIILMHPRSQQWLETLFGGVVPTPWCSL